MSLSTVKQKKKYIIKKSKAGHKDTYSSFPNAFCREMQLKLITDHTLCVYGAF